jgi:hypothetical protein
MVFDSENYRRNHYKGKICKHCKSEFWPEYAAQQYCSREDNPTCDDDRIDKRLWEQGKHFLQKLE